MRIDLQPGKYVVAVSGGVDSVVLLDLLMKIPDISLTIAHFDHGIRPDSADDAAFVERLAAQYGLPFKSRRTELGPRASEVLAREARYRFLRDIKRQTGARALITAHHQDDLLETAILNVLRGTGRRGLTSLKSTSEIKRPLLNETKAAIITYATKRNLSWHEDTTNHDLRYTRNYIRHRLLVRFDAHARQQLLAIIEHMQAVNREIDSLEQQLLQTNRLDNGLSRQWFASLPHGVAKDVLAAWLRQNGPADFDRQTIERLSVLAKTKPAGKRLDVRHGYQIKLKQNHLALELAER